MPPLNVIVVPPTPETLPPQLFEIRLSYVRPDIAGFIVVRSLVNPTPVAEKLRLKLSMVNSRVVEPPGATGSFINDFRIDSSVRVTSRDALALPEEVKSARRSLVTLSSCPTPLVATSTVTVQLLPAPRTSKPGKKVLPSALRITELEPGTAVIVVSGADALMQSVDALAGSATTRPAGKLSVKSIFPTADAFSVLSIVKVKVLRPPNGTELGEKLFVNPGRVVMTVRSVARLMLEPALEEMVTAGLV